MPRWQRVLPWVLYVVSRTALVIRLLSHGETTINGQWWRVGGPNLVLYTNLAWVVERGANPYALTTGPVPIRYIDYPPILMATFGTLAKLGNARLGIIAVCLLGEALLFVGTMRLAERRVGLDRFCTILLVLANPIWTEVELLNLQYKPLISAGLVALYLCWSPIISGVLSGAFVVPTLLIPLRLRAGRKWKEAAKACLVAAVCWIPFFPAALKAVSERRAERYAMVPYGDSILASVPFQHVPWVIAIGTACAAAILFLRGNTALIGTAAMVVLVCVAPDAPMDRTLAFALPLLICAPMGAYKRAGAFLTCCVCYLAFIYRWRHGGWVGYELEQEPLRSLPLLYAPIVWGVVAAIRLRNSPLNPSDRGAT